MYEVMAGGGQVGRKAATALVCWTVVMGVMGVSVLPRTGWTEHKTRIAAAYAPVGKDLTVWLRARIWGV